MQIASKEYVARVEFLIRLLEAVIILSKLLPVIVGVLAGISLVLAINNFVQANYAWGVVNALLAAFGVLFLIKLLMHTGKHFEHTHKANVN